MRHEAIIDSNHLNHVEPILLFVTFNDTNQ